jgi:hypothetical protein
MISKILLPRRAFLSLAACPLLAQAKANANPGLAAPWYVDQASPLATKLVQGIEIPDPSKSAADPTAIASSLTHWTRQVMSLVVKYQQNPLRAARALAYVNVAMHDAWVHATRLAPEASPALPQLAAHRAASLVIEQLYANETPGQFEAQFALLGLRLSPAPGEERAAIAVGQWVAASLIERSLRDGAGRVWPLKQRPAVFEGIWQPTYPMYAVNPTEGYAPQWRPWVIRSAQRYQPPPAPRPGSPRHKQETLEVLEVSRSLTDTYRQLAHQWNLEAGSVTPGGVWMQQSMDELEARVGRMPNAEPAQILGMVLPALTAVSVALHDAFVECWRVKLRDWSERPVTAIRRDLDPAFVPLLVTPGFPGYVSGHSTVSAAAATLLSHFWPDRATRFQALAEEASMSRLWGGIHFRSDNEEGLRLGQSVGGEVVARLLAA